MGICTLNWNEQPAAECRGGALAVGNFDGVHRGHQVLVAEAARQARTLGGPAVALTFDPHPLQILRPASFQPLLTTVPYRAELLHAAGADHVVVLETTGHGTGSGTITGTMTFDRKDYGMNGGIPFVQIGDHVDVTIHLKVKRVSGPPISLKS